MSAFRDHPEYAAVGVFAGYGEFDRETADGEARMSAMDDLSALDDLVAAARSCAADLGGNADSRIRQTPGGGFIMIEEARVRWLLKAVAKVDRSFPRKHS